MTNYFLVLGIDKSADESAIKKAFDYLNSKLSALTFDAESRAYTQKNKALTRINEAYSKLSNKKDRQNHIQVISQQNPRQAADFKPLLGHLCVAAGIITLNDLEDAVSSQKSIDIPLGQFLQEKQLLSQTELEGLLMGQKLYGEPKKPLDPIALRLLELDLATDDMVKIVVIDQKRSPANLATLMARRGWLEKDILSIIEHQPKN